MKTGATTDERIEAKATKRVKPGVRFEQMPLALTLLLISILLSIATQGLFMTPGNLTNVLRAISIELIVAVGMTVAMIARQIDLSVGSVLAVVGAATVGVFNLSGSLLVAAVAGIAVGAVIGLINGLLVTTLNVNSLVVTLGMLTLLRGVSYLTTDARQVQASHPGFTELGVGFVGPIPIPVLVAGAFAVGVHVLLRYTTLGRKIYAVGGNPEAARSAGLRVMSITVFSFILVGSCAAVSGVIMASRLNSFQPTIGTGFELTVIAAVILGGTRLTGGEGSVVGTVLGVLILGVLNNGMVLLGVSTFWQDVVRGGVIIIAVAIDEFRKNREKGK